VDEEYIARPKAWSGEFGAWERWGKKKQTSKNSCRLLLHSLKEEPDKEAKKRNRGTKQPEANRRYMKKKNKKYKCHEFQTAHDTL